MTFSMIKQRAFLRKAAGRTGVDQRGGSPTECDGSPLILRKISRR
jgi:hypothetical protein